MSNFVYEIGNSACSLVEAATGSLVCVSSLDVTATGIAVTGALVLLTYGFVSRSLLRGF